MKPEPTAFIRMVLIRVVLRWCVVITLATFAGCSTVTKEKVNRLPQAQPQVSPVLQNASEYHGLKRKVAIARFSNETRAGASLLLDKENDRIGKQASDILAARLTDSDKFILLERADLEKLNKELAFSGLSQNKIGADFLILGSVSSYGREAVSETGIFSRNKRQKATVTVNIRLVKVSNGQVIYSEEGSGEALSEANTVFGVGAKAGYDTTLDDKALSAAISKLVSNVIENLMEQPWRSYLIGRQGSLYIMTGGKSQGIDVGDEFQVMKSGRKVKNPQTGLLLELPGTNIATIKVQSFAGSGENEVSFAKVVSGNIAGQKLDELYVTPSN